MITPSNFRALACASVTIAVIAAVTTWHHDEIPLVQQREIWTHYAEVERARNDGHDQGFREAMWSAWSVQAQGDVTSTPAPAPSVTLTPATLQIGATNGSMVWMVGGKPVTQ